MTLPVQIEMYPLVAEDSWCIGLVDVVNNVVLDWIKVSNRDLNMQLASHNRVELYNKYYQLLVEAGVF